MKDIPSIGLGFWEIKKEDAPRVLKDGLEAGYKHIDTAAVYLNEKEIGDTLKEITYDRGELWVTTKIPAEFKTYKKAEQSIKDSLSRLGLKYVDLILIHAPKPWAVMFVPFHRYKKGNVEVYKAMIKAKDDGLVKQIGVSNFNIEDIENLIKNTGVVPYVNQIRFHAGHVDKSLLEYCKEKGIIVEAYSPNGHGHLMKNATIKEMSEKYGVSKSQLCIQFCLQEGTVPLPRSRSKNHIEENLKFDFTISEEDMKILENL